MLRAGAVGIIMLLLPMLPACQNAAVPVNDNAVARSGGREVGADAVQALPRLAGQQVYVPVYSHIYHRDQMTFDLTATVSIRNTSPRGRIIVTGAKYYNTAGLLLRDYVTNPVELPPLATLEYVIGESDSSGGSGANFIVDWTSDTRVSAPVVEAVMIGTAISQGISFISPGVVISGG